MDVEDLCQVQDAKMRSRFSRVEPTAITVWGGGLPQPRRQLEFMPLKASGRP
jgi:hypothetical protein